MQPEEAANVERESVAAAGPRDAAGAALVIPEDGLVIVPVRNMVLFPGMIVPITGIFPLVLFIAIDLDQNVTRD